MKTATGLVDYARAQLGRPYWFGTFGQLSTEKLWNDKAKQYPKYYSDVRKKKAIPAQCGKKTHDCAGLIKGYMWSAGPDSPAVYRADQDWGADTMYSRATVKGPIKTIPERPGLLVWRSGHIGVYAGNGKVIEAKGFDWGVVESNLKGSTFTHWLEYSLITYEAKSSAEPLKPMTPAIDATEMIARQVIAGQWGNGTERKDSLEKAGYDYATVQAKVNEILHGLGGSGKTPDRYRVATQRDNLNVRKTPNGTIIGSLPKGTLISVESIDSGWALVSSPMRGWVSATYLQKV